MKGLYILLPLCVSLVGCIAPTPKADDPYYAPVLPRTPLPASATNGAIYQAGFETNLYDDRKAFRVGDVITITLEERTQASKAASSDLSKDSSANIGLTSLFGGAVSATNPLTRNTMTLGGEYNGTRSNVGKATAAQSNSLSGSVTVTVAEVLPNGVLVVRGEKWLTLNTGNEMVRIAGLVRADDIASDNTVSSTRIADARLTYSGTGSFADSSQPGWLSQFFMSPLWPF
ncbi:flagellar basal body L-ring protein FlgH [Pseudomonas sp. C11]|jgi:flagellar L-ring protein precursor FlgH|uniref:flagellar basal body L-ring protein FlgH n=1 Tax=Pseudomonas sp. C11 TaxID=3075550 RepID=UPI002B002922|nr:flagellar basal body L-ring protein FlgH [Pseudomonas sp. C11]